jgi:hypothetical protein
MRTNINVSMRTNINAHMDTHASKYLLIRSLIQAPAFTTEYALANINAHTCMLQISIGTHTRNCIKNINDTYELLQENININAENINTIPDGQKNIKECRINETKSPSSI